MAPTSGAPLARLAACLLVPLSALGGFFAEHDQPLVAGVLVLANALPLAVLFKAGSIEIGRPHMLPEQVRWEAALSFGVMLIPGIPWMLQYQLLFSLPLKSMATLTFTFFATCLAHSFGGRGLYITLSVFSWTCGYIHLVTRDPGNASKYSPFALTFVALLLMSCSFLTYRRDQNTVYLAAGIGGLSIVGGGYWKSVGAVRGLLYIAFACVLVYLVFLWLRRRRNLPECFHSCKFIRLDYLRKLAAQGGPIRRCQELPPEAFGDVTKAHYLIIVSHRWINRRTCDVVTGEYPEGVRLRTMLRKLEPYFSTKGLGRGRSLAERWRRLPSCLTGGRDVVLFFDFMSLPQVGLAPDGSLLQRSDAEAAQFERCLPHMGILYSMFPVLVCDEVAGDVEPYSASGWCFSELMIGFLGNQLEEFSSDIQPVQQLTKGISIRGDALTSFIDTANNALASKKFRREGDRETVRRIISSFLLKSRLVDAINSKDRRVLSDVLRDFKELQLRDFLDQPVDASLNTPLHLAVAKGFTAGVEQLMQHGAKRSCRNWYGDTPVQRRGFPRVGKAAFACRLHKDSEAGTPSAGPAESIGRRTSHGAETPKEPAEEGPEEITYSL